jgi:hypothetical protein
LDGAILDINLGRERVYPLARVLLAKSVPIIFLTGERREELPQDLIDLPYLRKPWQAEQVTQVMESVFGAPTR